MSVVSEITSLNLDKTVEKKLKSAGIYTAEALREAGSKDAASRHRLRQRKTFDE
jgi:hypothetical protein